jgi:hypothetical protein
MEDSDSNAAQGTGTVPIVVTMGLVVTLAFF